MLENSQDFQWEYRVIHVNVVNNKHSLAASSPEEASQKLHGILSPEFIKKEFPRLYGKPQLPKHPAAQLQFVLNLLGKERWELIETSKLEGLLMFVFKRRRIEPPKDKD